MPRFRKKPIGVVLISVGLSAVPCLSGCEWIGDGTTFRLPSLVGNPSEDDGVSVRAKAAADRAVLARATDSDRHSVWIRAVHGPEGENTQQACRWRNRAMDDLLARPAAQQPDWRRLLDDPDPVVETHAAIALARVGDPMGAEQLAHAAQSPDFLSPMRCAAIEALAGLDRDACVSRLRELTDQYGGTTPEASAAYLPDLHAESIRGLARHVDPADDARFSAALRSRAAEVRLEALRAWAGSDVDALPSEIEDLRSDGDRRVRAAALKALGRRHPEGRRFLAAALSDHDLTVRAAAIAALGESADVESRELLAEQLDDPSEAIRAAAVSALAHSGDGQSVRRAVADQSWRVRLKVAEALGRDFDRANVATAWELLHDRSAEVQRQVVVAVAGWPMEESGPILLEALGSQSLMTRREAIDRLAAQWPEAAAFPLEGSSQRRQQALEALRAAFRRQFTRAAFDPAEDLNELEQAKSVPAAVTNRVAQLVRSRDVTGLADVGPSLVAAIEFLVFERQETIPEVVYREVLPDCNREFNELARLMSDDVFQRRRAAAALAALARQGPLGRLAVARLAELGVAEADDLVWHAMFDALADDGSEPSIRLAYAGLSHPAAEVRRRACDHLASHPDPANGKMLVPALEDRSEPVVLAAVRALGATGRASDATALRRVLRSKNEPLLLETANALVRLGDPMGMTTLEQLAFSGDPKIRCRVAEALGETADSAAIATLVGLLDDRPAVCNAALESLTRLVGRDVSVSDHESPTSVQRVQSWKEWFAHHPNAAGTAWLDGRKSR